MKHQQNILRLLAILAPLAWASCGSDHSSAAAEDRNPVIVTTALPSGSNQDGITISGQITAAQTAQISTRMMGTITQVLVKVGDRVRKGQLLVTLNSQDLLARKAQVNAAIAEAEANVRNAKKDFDRFTNLFEKQSASAKELDNMTLQYQSAVARLDAAKQMRNEVDAQMAYTHLTAPFDGLVTQKLGDIGSLANPGMPILTLEQAGQLQVTASVSETDIQSIQKGSRAKIEIRSIGRTFTAPISEVSPSSQFTGGQFLVKCNIPEADKKGLYAGMYANLWIASENQKQDRQEQAGQVLVPANSLVHHDQLVGLYTISSQNTALLRWIRTGKTIGDQVEVLSGLSANEPFILSAESKLYNGAPVTEKK